VSAFAVIASAAKQTNFLSLQRHELLRCARNDEWLFEI
jgi:hypothetical protein